MKKLYKYLEKDTIHETPVGLNPLYTKKILLREVTITFDLSTKKGKAIGQLLDGIRRLL